MLEASALVPVRRMLSAVHILYVVEWWDRAVSSMVRAVLPAHGGQDHGTITLEHDYERPEIGVWTFRWYASIENFLGVLPSKTVIQISCEMTYEGIGCRA